MVIVCERECSKFTINPACTRLHEAIFTSKLWEHILLNHQLGIGHVVFWVCHVGRQQAESVQQGFSVTEIFRRWSRKVLNEELQEVSKVLGNLVLSGLADATDSPDELLVGSLDVVRVGAINLKAHELNGVFWPELELVLWDQTERQSELEQNSLDVISTQTAHLSLA